jgi:hypothetical protein
MKRTIGVVSWAVLSACGGGGASVTTADQVRDFDATAQAISSAASSYGTATAAMPGLAACTADESGYEAQVRPLLDHMRTGSAGMDTLMSSLGPRADADMACATSAMAAELAHHAAIACASPTDMSPNESEAARHVQAMIAWADHQHVRTEQMGSMMGMGGMAGGMTTGTCRRNADGTYTLSGG